MTIRNKKYKRSGSILASVMVAAIVWIMIAQSMFITFSGQFKMISSSRTALQAQQYAEIALDKLKNINYDELDASGAHGRKKIEGISSDDWQDEVTIGAESTIAGSDDAKQRIATVNVYKVGDTLPRYTVEVPLSSQGNSLELPIGTILPYVGDMADIPEGWALCDGSNGTLDMRDLFIVGAGKNYELYNTGGKNEVELNADQLPAHYHNLYTSRQFAINRNGSVWGIEQEGWTLVEENTGTRCGRTGYSGNTSGKTVPHENRPPYIAVYYIMRIK